MTKGNTRKLMQVLSWLMAVVLLFGAVGGITVLIAKQKGITFYVEYGGKKYLSTEIETSDLWLKQGGKYVFKVSPLDKRKAVDYAVKVESNPKYNFEYTAEGKVYMWYGDQSSENDYTQVFQIDKTADGFSITVPKNFTVQSAIASRHQGEIAMPETMAQSVEYFVLKVITDKRTLSFPFATDQMKIELSLSDILM